MALKQLKIETYNIVRCNNVNYYFGFNFKLQNVCLYETPVDGREYSSRAWSMHVEITFVRFNRRYYLDDSKSNQYRYFITFYVIVHCKTP